MQTKQKKKIRRYNSAQKKGMKMLKKPEKA